MMGKMKAPKMPGMRGGAMKSPQASMGGMPDFAQRAKRPGGMKKGGMIAMPKIMKPAKKGKR